MGGPTSRLPEPGWRIDLGVATSGLEQAVLRKLKTRLLPYLFALYVVAYLDRVNVGFAALQMNRDLGFDSEVFGFGSGIFFVGYMLFQVPSNLVLQRLGARRLISTLMVVWGLCSMAMVGVKTREQFYVLRFGLGLAEAGFFPGVVLYLTYWFPARQRAQAVSLFMTATAISGVIGGPLSGALLDLHGKHGVAGWQWLFLIEATPAVMLGVVTWFYLPDGPSDAGWMTPEERHWLSQELERERGPALAVGASLAQAFSGRVWYLSLLYFCLVCSMYSVTLWMPQIIQGFSGFSDFTVGCLSAVPYLCAAYGMVAVGHHSDRTNERRWHVAGSAWVGALGLSLAAWFAHSPWLGLAALSLAALGIWGTVGPFWALPTTMLSGTAAAAGIALVNSIGNLGGFAGPYAVGVLKKQTGFFSAGLYGLAGLLVVGGLLALSLRPSSPRPPAP